MGELVVGGEDCKEIVEEEVGNGEEGREKEMMMLKWKEFLPRMMVRVLLVEFDDSTRQIITALLRKCSYEVSAVQDGKRAWEILKEKPLSFDLVLTEVSLPSLSGFALLTMIVENPLCKNIPVIMMSSHDSINIVFKCMLQGASDFLVKPIRKNELRNLWQHVWRRRSFNDSASGCQSQNPAERKSEAVSDNNSASNRSSDYVVSVHKNIESCEKGSDTQSSSTRPEEAESINMQVTKKLLPSQMEPGLRKYQDSIKENANCLMRENEAEGKSIGRRDINVGSHTKTKMHLQGNHLHERHLTVVENLGSSSCRKASVAVSGSNLCDPEQHNPPREAIDFLGGIRDTSQDNCPQNDGINIRHGDHTNSEENSMTRGNKSSFQHCPPCELSLRRPQLNGCNEQGVEEKHILNHSKASPFLRYGNRSVLPGAPVSCFSPEPKQGEGECHSYAPTESEHNTRSGNVFSPRPIKWSNLNRNEISSDGREGDASAHSKGACLSNGTVPEEATFPCSRFGIVPMLVPVGGLNLDGLGPGYGTTMQPVFYAQQVPPPWSNTDKLEANQQKGFPQFDHQLRQGKPEHLHHLGKCDATPLETQLSNKADAVLGNDEDPGFASASCESESSFCNCGVKHHSVSNSGNVSNGNNGNISAADVADATTKGGKDMQFLNSGVGSLEHNRLAQREAALTKFRLKRKERCFEKKVRYQSRKILAEQRPRVKGQFVRQLPNDSTPMQVD
ncbi:two-component response regulator-like APRR5 [Nymphaea colorata]|nr:two-component response regulator-like APRR5 [Nymphaea colorata]